MTPLAPTVGSNHILRSLSSDEYQRFKSLLKPAHLPRGRVLCEAGDPAQQLYFPLSGVISLLSTTEKGDVIEVAMVGNEGTTALPLLTHSREMPYRAQIQVAADALVADLKAIQDEMIRSRRLEDLLLCYSHGLFTEVAQSAVCNRFHTAEQRFCRWLLCIHDRVKADTIELTHEIISNMLGVQRSVVTTTAGVFQKMGFVTYSRGTITICDREGLQNASCECYRIVKRQTSLCSSNCFNPVSPHGSG